MSTAASGAAPAGWTGAAAPSTATDAATATVGRRRRDRRAHAHRPLTTFDIDDYVYEALRLGASGFMLKDAPADELVRAVRVVAGGDQLLAPSITRRLIEESTRRRGTVPRHSPQLDLLTAREREVLELVAGGLSNGEIADELFLAEQTVKTHVSRVLTKLALRDLAQAVVFAYEHGVVVPGA
ncbi:LuxR C-terminal-related transcriptional regulator [Janibacter anophelis]|uniref:LuxR C-terminal-related transcriptional regulator n=1 Tax=Janibacter anophelis TaxID=319054 RepID=UPI001FD425A5|nr:response regulator transcription factor [Janibacter anophelis]